MTYAPLDVARFEEDLGRAIGAPAAAGVAGIYHYAASGRAAGLLPVPGRRRAHLRRAPHPGGRVGRGTALGPLGALHGPIRYGAGRGG
ncbi:hypothetical protein [Streptomyces sp. NBC_00996]|uniref:hypothetical protein n=1 Tax=Streptomyces sp. NBC_00996 TaxID=2903710 RepID=UPI00386D0C01|nr:hypothetical protein OG390_15115 [Streptomyces sp. NBC_00996]